MTDQNEKIYDSPPSGPDDEFWLEQGRELIKTSIPGVRDAAKSLMTGLGLFKGIYLGIVGFAEFIPKTIPVYMKCIYMTPMVFWMAGAWLCLRVLMTRDRKMLSHSPDDIRRAMEQIMNEKQGQLEWAFGAAVCGMVFAMILVILRFGGQ